MIDCGLAKETAIVSKFIWANHSELINLEAVSMIRLLAGDNVAHAFFPGSDKPVIDERINRVVGPRGFSGKQAAQV